MLGYIDAVTSLPEVVERPVDGRLQPERDVVVVALGVVLAALRAAPLRARLLGHPVLWRRLLLVVELLLVLRLLELLLDVVLQLVVVMVLVLLVIEALVPLLLRKLVSVCGVGRLVGLRWHWRPAIVVGGRSLVRVEVWVGRLRL